MIVNHEFTADGSSSYTMPVAFDPLTVCVKTNRALEYSAAWYYIQSKTLTFLLYTPDSGDIVKVTGEVAR